MFVCHAATQSLPMVAITMTTARRTGRAAAESVLKTSRPVVSTLLVAPNVGIETYHQLCVPERTVHLLNTE